MLRGIFVINIAGLASPLSYSFTFLLILMSGKYWCDAYLTELNTYYIDGTVNLHDKIYGVRNGTVEEILLPC